MTAAAGFQNPAEIHNALVSLKQLSLDESHLAEDRLSPLPDEILLMILSFLTFKEVVQTSVLSRSWLNFWIHSLVLHFDALFPKVAEPKLITYGERKSYVELVNRVLLQHKGQFLKEFKILWPLDKRNQENIDNWLGFAFAKKVECLEVNLFLPGQSLCYLNDNYAFPWMFLQLDGIKCLKSLSLKRVNIAEEGINFFLVNCPLLETLEVVANPALFNLVISDPTLVLKHLTIKHCRRLKDLCISNLNLLVSLDISALPAGNLTLTGLPMLVELFIAGAMDMLTRYMFKASACFSKLEELKLDSLFLEDVTQLLNYGGKFKKLKRLVLCFAAIGDESLTNLISIVNSCPHLQEFVLMLVWASPERARRPIYKAEITRKSLKSEKPLKSIKSKSLKIFEFGGYYGRFCDVELINAVKNGVGLEKIIIVPRDGRLLIPDICRRPAIRKEEEEEETRKVALGQYDSLRESIPPHVHLFIR